MDVVNSIKDVKLLINLHEHETVNTYRTIKYDKYFGDENIDLSSNTFTIRYEDTQKNATPQIPFDGIPFIIRGKKTMECHQGKDRNVAKKMKAKQMREQQTDHDFTKHRHLVQNTKKRDCPAMIKVRHIIKLTDYKLEKNTTYGREQMSAMIHSAVDQGRHVNIKHVYLVSIPCSTDHMNHHSGEVAQLIQPLDARLRAFIKDMVKERNTLQVSEMKLLLDIYVKETLFKDQPLPPLVNTRYWTSQKTIRNHILLGLMEIRNSTVDQKVVEDKISEWKEQFPQDKFYLRLKEDRSEPESSMNSLDISDKDEFDSETASIFYGNKEKFLYVHLTEWQRRLLNMYGSEIALLDGTYRTTKYALPLYFLCVPTNVNYITVATFVIETEDKKSIMEALHMIKEWNPEWKQTFFMSDYCEEEISSLESVFPVHKIDNGCIIKARCFRSMKKNESPHNMEVTLLSDPSVTSSICTCTIGQGGSCGHVVGLLYFLAHMKSSGFKSIPSDVLKTSLPQTWHVPRGDKLQGSAVDNVVLCGYSPKDPTKQPRGLRSTLYNPIKGEFPEVHDLCDAFSNIDNSILLMSVIENTEPPKLETRFGKFVKGSPLSYQQKQSSQYVLNILGEDFPVLPIENCMENEVAVVLNSTSTVNFQSIMVSRNESEEIEKMTRLQSSDPKWHAVRRDRITASVAGDIIKRRADNDPLVTRLKSTRKVMTEAMRHGVMFEPIAANAYSSLQNNNVNIFPCGIVVSPYASWLAASPDRKVYNPAMRPPYGLLEIKCPVKQLADCIYLTKSDDGRICLKKNHNYYYQVMMQMAVTGLQWCHFFVWRPDEQHIEKINFDQEEWNDMKRKLDMFYFYHFLN